MTFDFDFHFHLFNNLTRVYQNRSKNNEFSFGCLKKKKKISTLKSRYEIFYDNLQQNKQKPIITFCSQLLNTLRKYFSRE